MSVHRLATHAPASPATAVIQRDTERLAEMRILVAFALHYRRGHVLAPDATGDLAVIGEVEQRIAHLAAQVAG